LIERAAAGRRPESLPVELGQRRDATTFYAPRTIRRRLCDQYLHRLGDGWGVYDRSACAVLARNGHLLTR
jgi:hypothetical protein